MAKMTVYHGGYISVENPQVRIGRNTKDFGTGFYCTVIKEQAQRWAKRYDTKVVSIYEVRIKFGFEHQRVSRNDRKSGWILLLIAGVGKVIIMIL